MAQQSKKSTLAGETYAGRQARENSKGKERGPDLGSQRNGLSDQWIRHQIEELLAHNPNVEHGTIEVTVEHGDVVLLGTARSAESRDIAEQLARAVEGVKSVRNDINVD